MKQPASGFSPKTLSIGLLVGILLLLLLPGGRPAADPARNAVERAWQLAQSSGSYAFYSRVDQETLPAPSLRSAGRPPRHDYLTLQGKIDQPTEHMELSLWRSLNPNPASALELRIDGARAEGRSAGGAWQPIEFDTLSFAPGGDPLGFLSSARDISAGVVESRSLGASELSYTTYSFTLDGAAFGRYLERRLEPELRRQGKLPVWMDADFVQVYQSLSGSGKIWIDQDGLPARLTLDVTTPGKDGQGTVKAAISTDFSSFDRQRLALASSSFATNPLGWIGYRLELYQPALQSLALHLLGMLVVLWLLALSVRYWRRRGFYAATAMLAIVSMLLAPLTQAGQARVFAAQQQAAEQQQAQIVEEQQAEADALASQREPRIDPHVGIAPHPPTPFSHTGEQGALLPSPLVGEGSGEKAMAAPLAAADTDSDGDGLSDSNELLWGSCAKLPSASEECEGVTNSTDSDGDGLSDGIEVNSLGLLPGTWDSDNDAISDTLEVNGFSYNNKMWYLDPEEVDTNRDGVADTFECSRWLAGSQDFNLSLPCNDTDSDGTPDVWDEDNDNDGVHDSVDLEPNKASPGYSDDQPLSLSISSLTPNKPVFVDLQIRPTDADQLYYMGSVLDWPSGDNDGQIQRRLSTTFASTANAEIQSDDLNAANGDIRITPLLEITMPYQAGHYANLPRKAAYQNIDRTTAITVGQWLDTSMLDVYGIQLVDSSANSLIAYVPLTAVEDSVTGGRAAFSARMVYQPSQTNAQGVVNWGQAQQYRIIWMVQMITDTCTNTSNLATCSDKLTVPHIYRDEGWRLSGLAVREDHGIAVNILYEDPAQETVAERQREDDLWVASLNLNKTWMRARDCDQLLSGNCQGNDARDVTIANMESKLDSWSAPAGGDAIEAVNRSYLHQGYLTHVMMTDTISLLQGTFSPAGMDETALLFAHEETYRAGSLDIASIAGGSLSVPMDQQSAPKLVKGSMSWARYQRNAGVWQNYDSEQDIKRLALELADESFFQAAGPDSDSQDEAAGKIIWAQAYYSNMLTGLSSLLEIADETTWTDQADVSDVTEGLYEPLWPSSTFTGISYAVYDSAFLLWGGLSADVRTSFWQGMSNWMEKSSSLGSALVAKEQIKGVKLAGNILVYGMILSSAVGFALLAGGFFGGNKKVEQAGVYILNGATLVAGMASAMNIGLHGLEATIKATRATSGIAGTVLGALISLAVIWGFFGLNVGLSGAANNTGSMEYQIAVAFALAQTIVALVLMVIEFALNYFYGVGSLIMSILYMIDALLVLAGKKGIQQMVTTELAKSLYDIDLIVKNFNSPDRVDFAFTGMTVADDQAGFTEAQQIVLTMKITNTLQAFDNVSADDLKHTTIRYALESKAADHHKDLRAGQMNAQWQTTGSPGPFGQGSSWVRSVTTVQSSPISFSSLGTGINRSGERQLYLNESFALPYEGCWSDWVDDWGDTTGWWDLDYNCSFGEVNDTISYPVGQYHVFDVLPASLSSFARMDWNRTYTFRFPGQVDSDNDGLLANDPSGDSWDADFDGLSDASELSYGTNPGNGDSDGDGLGDQLEIRWLFNPLNGDSDDDGMSDREEYEGWRTSYQVVNGTPKYTWVWSDPFNADVDNDGLNDMEEFFYALNPNVATDADEILNTITFDNSVLSERSAPLLLMGFEEDEDARIFADHSGNRRLSRCSDGASCPTAGGLGRYGSALSYDGVDDKLLLEAAEEGDFDLSSLTVAAWIKVSSFNKSWQAIVTKGDTSWRLQRFNNTNFIAFSTTGLSNVDLAGDINVADGQWHHVAGVYTGSAKYLYVDGVLDSSIATTGALSANNYAVAIGASAQSGNRGFKGAIDEVAIYNRAFSQAQIQALMQGVYNPNDYVVQPGETLDASLSINNNSPNAPAAVTYHGQVDEDFTGTTTILPHAKWSFEEGSDSSAFADSSGGARNLSCNLRSPTVSVLYCPTSGVSGYRGKGIELTRDALLKLDPGLTGGDFNYSWAIGGWFYPTGGGTDQQIIWAMQSGESTTDNNSVIERLQYDLRWNEYRLFESPSGAMTGMGVLPLNQWTHIMVVTDRVSHIRSLYINGQISADGVLGSNRRYDPLNRLLRLGDPISYDSGHSFVGRADELVIYRNTLLTAEDVQRVMQGLNPLRPVEPTVQRYSVPVLGEQQLSSSFSIPASIDEGSFEFTQSAEAALDIEDEYGFNAQPVVRAHFDALVGFTEVYAGGGATHFDCGTGCPTKVEDFAGYSIDFDGVDDSLNVNGLSTNGQWSIGLWFKATDVSTKRALFGVRGSNAASSLPSLAIDTDRQLVLGYFSGNWQEQHAGDSNKISLNVWHQVTLTFNGSNTFKLYLDGRHIRTFTATPGAATTGNFSLGKIGNEYALFKGRMDNYTLYGVELSAAKVQLLSSQPDLGLFGHYNLDEPPGDTTFSDLAGMIGDASCTNCPILGIDGLSNNAAYFNLNQISTPTLDSFWQWNRTSYTYAGWVKLQRGQLLESHGQVAPVGLWNDRLGSGRGSGSSVTGNTDYYDDSSAFRPVSANQWSHLAYVMEDRTRDRYGWSSSYAWINGDRVSWDLGLAPQNYGSGGIQFGANALGYIDELRIYQRALRESELEDLYQNSAPVLLMEFEEGRESSSFGDSSSNNYDGVAHGATSGNTGRVGNGLTLDGNDYVKISNAPKLDATVSDMTLMAWVKPEDSGAIERTIAASYGWNSNNGWRLQLTTNGFMIFGSGSDTVFSSGNVPSGQWSHIAVVLRDGRNVSFYIDGVFAGSSMLPVALITDGDNKTAIGARDNGFGNHTGYYTGKIDELAIYPRLMSNAEIKAAYNTQFRSFRKEHSVRVTVDLDAPGITLLSDDLYWANDDFLLTVATTDTTSGIFAFDYSVTGANGTTLVGQAAQPCMESQGNSLWCIPIDPASFGGAGKYTFQFRAVDGVGNQTTSESYTIYVDGTAPVVSAAYAGEWVTPTPDPDEELTWSLPLSGTIGDPDLTLTGGITVTGVGLDLEAVSVALLDDGGEPLVAGPFRATVNADTWSVDYQISGAYPSGSYRVQVTAADTLGNSSTTIVGSLRMDEQPPAVELNTRALNQNVLKATTLTGLISDRPLPPDVLVAFPFSENNGATSFSGSRTLPLNATCTSCPTRTSGVFGYGLSFSNDNIAVPATTTLDLDAGTLSAWIRPTWASGSPGYHPAILGVRNGSNIRFSWHIGHNYSQMLLHNGQSQLGVPVSITPNQWTHVALVSDGSSWTAYVNGVAAGSVDQSFGSFGGLPLNIGSSTGTWEYFAGDMDEVLIFDRALSAAEVYQLAQEEIAGVSNVQLAIEELELGATPDLSFDDPSTAWITPTITSGSNAGQSNWSYTLPAGMESFYQIKLRGSDQRGHINNAGIVWRGMIDSFSPRVSGSARHIGGMFSGTTEYTVVFEERFMDLDSIVMPCSGGRTYTYDGYGMPVRLEITCSTSSLQLVPRQVKLCDFAGNCSEIWVSASESDTSELLIQAPTSGEIFRGLDAVSLAGKVWADDKIRTIAITVNGSLVQSWSYPQSPGTQQASWSSSWTPPFPGTFDVLLEVSDWASHSYSETTTFRVVNNQGPAGVSSNLAFWLDPSEDLQTSGGVTLTTGVSVTTWIDQAQGMVGQHTVDNAPTYSSQGINFNPSLSFGAGGPSELSFGADYPSMAPGSSEMTIFAVTAPLTSTPRPLLDIGRFNNDGYGLQVSSLGATGYTPQGNTLGGSGLATSGGLPDGATAALLGYQVSFGSGNTLSINEQEVDVSGNTELNRLDSANIAHSATHDAASGPLTLGRQSDNSGPSNYFQGELAEVLVYTGTLTLAERNRLASYLGLKYGLTLPISYTLANGGVIWNSPQQIAAGFHHRVAAIGRDDAMALEQIKSRSSSAEAVLTISNGHPAQPELFMSGESFLAWGDDDGSITSLVTMTQGTLRYQRLERIWQAREIGSVGGVRMTFDLDSLATPPTRVWLAVGSQPDLSDASLIDGTIVDNQAIFKHNLSDGQYFTLAIKATQRVNLTIQGAGSGTVASIPSKLTCTSSCSGDFEYRSQVKLKMTTATGMGFGGWSGPCVVLFFTTCTLDVMDATKNVTLTFNINSYPLQVNRTSGTGLGSVSSSGGGISCGSDCLESYLYGTVVTLTAVAYTGSSFAGWSGACAGALPTCVVTVDLSNQVTALFSNPDGYPYGEIAWPVPGTIQAEHYNVGGQNVAYYDTSMNRWNGYPFRTSDGVDTSYPEDGSPIIGMIQWGEWLKYTIDVESTGFYRFSARVSYPLLATATYKLFVDGVEQPQRLSIPSTGGWGNYQTFSVGGIYLTEGEHVLRILFDYPLSQFNWFSFARQATLEVHTAGDGQGVVTSSPAGIDCGGDCQEHQDLNTQVTLSATPNTGSAFEGWSGACANASGDCVVTLDQSKSVTATYSLNHYPLNLSFAGAGSGTVSISVDGTSTECSADCTISVPHGSIVELQATATSGLFFRWDGDCFGESSSCGLGMEGPKSITATFEPFYTFKVAKTGSGFGLVRDTGNGNIIYCADDCEEGGWNGFQYELRAEPDGGSTFVGWSGNTCSGSNEICAFTLDQTRVLTATFTRNYYDLDVSLGGNGSGSVTGVVAGISCAWPPQSGTCSANLGHGTVVTLIPTPGAGSMLLSWGGACSGTHACVVTMDQAKSVSATFATCSPTALVSNGNDSGPGSLRQALSGVCTDGTVSFAGDLTIALQSQIVITRGLTIDGGAHDITISGALNGDPGVDGGIFSVDAGRPVTLRNLAFVDGTASNGGAIYGLSQVSVIDSSFEGNSAGDSGGAIYVEQQDRPGEILRVIDSSFEGNSAGFDGGGVALYWSDSALISGSSFISNTAMYGGGLYQNNEALTVVDSSFSYNQGTDAGGGIGQGRGDLRLFGSVVSQNSSQGEGGGIWGYGYGAIISETLIIENQAFSAGGLALCGDLLTASSVLSNTATFRGGGIVSCGDELLISDSTIAHNNAGAPGAGLFIPYGHVVIDRSTFAYNSTTDKGGAIYATANTEAEIENATFAYNGAEDGGGAIYVSGAGWTDASASVSYSTFSGNAAASGGVLQADADAFLHLRNSLVANSAGADCVGGLDTNENNLVEDGSCDAALSGDPLLGALAPNDGAPANFALLEGSPAIDAAQGDCPIMDQRWFARPAGSACDIGAYERGALPLYRLSVSKQGTGTVSGGAIDCGESCGALLGSGTLVTLTAQAGYGASFSGWSGDCSGAGQCVVAMSQARSVTAIFVPMQYALSVGRQGSGTVSSPLGISCGADCSEIVSHGTLVTLTATAASGSSFEAWSEGCLPSADALDLCVVSMEQAQTITASFKLNSYTLGLSIDGNGQGSVAGSPANVSCGGASTSCSELFHYGTQITLTATAATGFSFAGWGGACSGSGTCVVTVDSSKIISASFVLPQHALGVSKTGAGSGTVFSNPTGISCGADCAETFNQGTVVTLTAVANSGSLFAGWGGACSGTGSCVVTIDQARSVSASFALNQVSLSVTLAGNGLGTVSSSPAGINCGSDCSETLSYGSVITLTASAATGSSFVGWSGACAGSGVCVVTMSQAKSVLATFTPNLYSLSVSKSGAGSGTITSTPLGISCGVDCTESIAHGTVVTLTAVANVGSTFTGWGGACSGTGQCVVTMDQARSVSATFTLAQALLSVTLEGNGLGTVSSSPTGISCGADCSENFSAGVQVTLTASATPGSRFDGWGGGCAGSGTGQCAVTMDQSRSVSATFTSSRVYLPWLRR